MIILLLIFGGLLAAAALKKQAPTSVQDQIQQQPQSLTRSLHNRPDAYPNSSDVRATSEMILGGPFIYNPEKHGVGTGGTGQPTGGAGAAGASGGLGGSGGGGLRGGGGGRYYQ